MAAAIKLRCSKSQVDFDNYDKTVRVVYIILGREFIENDNSPRVNSNIPAMFIASALQVDPDIQGIRRLCRKIFLRKYLKDQNKVLASVRGDLTIPKPRYYQHFIRNDRKIPTYPVLMVEDWERYIEETPSIRRNLDFLFIFFMHIRNTTKPKWFDNFVLEDKVGLIVHCDEKNDEE